MADTAGLPANDGGFPSSETTHRADHRPPALPDETISNGPIATAVKNESAKTAAEISNLANSRQTPSTPAATGQPLTHYHSLFYELLSWNNPRVSGIAYASIVTFIFAVRFLDVIRWGLRLSYLLLGVTVAAEAAGKLVLNKGLASQLRPRKYYTLPRESLESIIGDVHELLNFFVIEAQRILYVENVYASAAACVAAFLSYYLVKIVPYWGLALLGTSVLFVSPLIYKTNKEFIDEQLKHASDLVNAQTSQLRDVANKHTAHATEVTKQYMGDYTAKAQQLLSGRGAPAPVPAPVRVPAAVPVKPVTVASAPAAPTTEPTKKYDVADFPAAPKEELKAAAAAAAVAAEEEPLIAS